jgi:hypothetical protein
MMIDQKTKDPSHAAFPVDSEGIVAMFRRDASSV